MHCRVSEWWSIHGQLISQGKSNYKLHVWFYSNVIPLHCNGSDLCQGLGPNAPNCHCGLTIALMLWMKSVLCWGVLENNFPDYNARNLIHMSWEEGYGTGYMSFGPVIPAGLKKCDWLLYFVHFLGFLSSFSICTFHFGLALACPMERKAGGMDWPVACFSFPS